MKRTILLPTLLLLSLLTVAAAPRIAAACGGETTFAKLAKKQTATERVRDLVEAHFAAIAAGDADAVLALWDPKAKVKSLDGAGKLLRTVTIEKALPRWIEKREGMSWSIGRIAEMPRSSIFKVFVEVTWNGVVYRDVLRIRSKGDKLTLIAKQSTPRDAEQPKFGY
jgi:hypothetical protein